MGTRWARTSVAVLRPLAGLWSAAVLLGLASPAAAARVTGAVVDAAGRPVEYATVSVAALKQGGMTDDHGLFTLELPDGPAILEVSQIGYERARASIVVAAGMGALRIVLHDEPVPLAEVTVATSAFGKAGKSEGAVVRRLDIVSTPGGAADIFQALRALPGLNAPGDGAALYVRGGDPRETLIRLDNGDIGHPYHWEGASGGLFSAIDTYMIESAFFSTGGFSTKYGGALSGVLDIQTEDPHNLKTVSLGANMAGASASSSWSLVPDRLSFVGSLAHSATGLLDKLYPARETYVHTPSSLNGVGKLLYRYSPTGRASLLFLESHDQVGVVNRALNTSSTYEQTASNRFAAVQFQDVIAGKIALKGQAAGQWFRSRWSYGPIATAASERNGEGNLDLVWPAGNRHELSFGGNLHHLDTAIRGRMAADSTDLQPGAPTRDQVSNPVVENPGVYLEDKMRVAGPLYATLGSRFDYASTPGIWTADPRAALAWRIDLRQTARFAIGRYHELADPRFLDPVYGNPRLGPLTANHVIAGYEWKTDDFNVRLETYHKEYRGLVRTDSAAFYAGTGSGYARGVDLFLQGTRGQVTGWVSYGYMDSQRQEMDDPHRVRSRYGTGHAVTLTSRWQVTSKWQLGAKYNYTTGRPVTPVVGATFDPARGIWHPIYGEHNSDRLPDYHRLDVRFTRLFSIPEGAGLPASGICVFYVEGLNVLGLRNAQDYVYSSDYSRREQDDSVFSRRLLVAGFSLSW